MIKLGLTGGIGSGKSTVSAMFRELGAHVIDADVLAREALAPGSPASTEVVRSFGEGILGPDGGIDRKALADVVFGDAAKRAALEAVVHPYVFREAERITCDIAKAEPDAVVVFDAALIIETGAHRRMDRVVVVWCRPDTQLARVMRKFGFTENEARLRVAAQMPLYEKRAYASHVVDNDGPLDDTRRQVEAIYREVKQYV